MKHLYNLNKLYFSCLIILILSCSQQNKISKDSIKHKSVLKEREHFRLMFYNCENLFDTYNDSLKQDDEFTPEGKRHWTPDKYYKKINNIAKVITGIGG